MAYVYRFKNTKDEIIYVGYTGQALKNRMHQHWDKGHLPSKCYNQVARIEYIQYPTKADAMIMETYYINKFKPIYNKQSKQMDCVTIHIDKEKEWKLYKSLQVTETELEKENILINFLEFGCVALITLLIFKVLNIF